VILIYIYIWLLLLKKKNLQNDVAGVVEAECSCRVAGVVEKALKNKRKNRNKKNLQNGSTHMTRRSTQPRPILNGSGLG
jgi:hypothetical protein